MIKLLRALLVVSALCVPASASFINIGGNGRFVLPAGGEFDPGNAYATFDFDASIDRDESYASKETKFLALGFDELSDYTLNTNRGGWFWTADASEAASDVGYSGGAFPFPGKSLLIEANPNFGAYDGPANGRQSNHYLRYDDWRPRIWWQYWEYLVSGERSHGDKLWYPACWTIAGDCSGTDQGFWLIYDGSRASENSNPLQTLGDRNTFHAGSESDQLTYVAMNAEGFAGVDGNLVNSNTAAPGSEETVCYQNVEITPTQFGEWVLHKFFVDVSGPQGKYGYWTRRVGEPWVQHAYFEGGVTPGFDWDIPEELRTRVQQVKTPTTVNQRTPTEATDALGPHVRMWGYLQFADDEEDLAIFADDPDLAWHYSRERKEWLARDAANDDEFRLRASR